MSPGKTIFVHVAAGLRLSACFRGAHRWRIFFEPLLAARSIPGHLGTGYSWSDPACYVRPSGLNMMLVRSGYAPSALNDLPKILHFNHGRSFNQAVLWRLARQQLQSRGTRTGSPWIDAEGKEMTSYNIVTTCMRRIAWTTGGC